MCRLVVCKTCSKMTWRGCGMHVQQVMAGVPKDDRCQGHPDQGKSFIGRLFGRG